MPAVGPNDVLIKIKDRDLRHRHAHLQLGRVGAEDHPGADARRPRILRRDRRDGQRGARLQASATASPARATSPAAIAAIAAPGERHLCRNTVGRRRQPARLPSPSTCRMPASNVFKLPAGIPDEIASILDPSAMRRTPRSPSTWSARTCSSPAPAPSASWRRRSPPRRRAPRGHHRRQRLPPGPRARSMGATRARERRARDARRRSWRSSAWSEGFDVGLGDVAATPRPSASMLDAMNHGGQRRDARHPRRGHRHRLEPGHLQGADAQGHLRPRDVRDLVQDVAMLQSGLDISPVITHRLPMAQFETGFAALNAGQACKVVLDINA